MANQINPNVGRAVADDGLPSSGARAYFYNVGTTTSQTVYTDSALTTAHTQPLVANSSGVFPPVYTDGTVQTKVLVTNSLGAPLPGYPLDPAYSIPLSTSGASAISFVPPDWSGSTTVQGAIEEVYEDSLQNVVEDTTPQLGGSLSANGNRIELAIGANLTADATLNVGGDGNFFSVNGSGPIAAISESPRGTQIGFRFLGETTIEHHADDLVLPSGADITTAAGDVMWLVSMGGGQYRCTGFMRASGKALIQSDIIDADYTSPEQAIASGSLITLAHGLGAKPSRLDVVMVCKTAEEGWAVGDEIDLPSRDSVSSAVYNFTVGRDETNIYIATGASGVSIHNKTTGAGVVLTNGNWRIIARAWV